jgi:hypothetical protein
MTTASKLIQKISALPEECLGEVERFVDEIHKREGQDSLTHDYARSNMIAFGAVWNNESDAAYDAL